MIDGSRWLPGQPRPATDHAIDHTPTVNGGIVGRRARSAPPWDQQWSLRLQQVLAFESDLRGAIQTVDPAVEQYAIEAVRARDVGFEVVYQGIRLTPSQIVAAAVAEDVNAVGLSILFGSHRELYPQVLAEIRTSRGLAPVS